MAFGSPPKFIASMGYDHLTHPQFLVIAIEAAKKIGLEIRYVSDAGFIAMTHRGMFKANAKITVKLAEESASLRSESTGSEAFDLGRNRKNIQQLTDAFQQTRNTFSEEALAQKYEELKPTLVAPEQDVLIQPPPEAGSAIAGVLSLFKPREGYFITPIIVNINIAVFILMVISGVNFFLPDNESLIKWGANFRPITLEGQWWRLITNFFLHIGIVHLLFNMYALVLIGILLEPLLGKARFLSAYFLTGIIASITSLSWHDLTISAGASGAIFGMYGVFLAMLTTNLVEKSSRKALLTSIGIFVVYNLTYGMKGGVDNAAHVGGLLSGVLIGYCFYPSLKKPGSSTLEYATIALLSLFAIVTSFTVYHKIPNDIGKYDEQMKSFASMENTALAVYRLPKGAPKEKLLSAITDSGLVYWNKNIELLNGMEKLKVPPSVKDRTDILINYCNLRIKAFHLIYKAINEDTDIYQDSITSYNTQIEAAINSLKGK